MSTLTVIVVVGTALHLAVLAVMIWIRVRPTEGDRAGGTPKFTPCAVCGEPAVGWRRYNGFDPNEQVTPSTYQAWADDMAHYRPLCAEHAAAAEHAAN